MRKTLLMAVLLAAVAAPVAAAAGRVSTTRPTTARQPAAILARLQASLAVIARDAAPTPDATADLTAALAAARGARRDGEAVPALAAALGQALAGTHLDDDSVERLAQNLYAALDPSGVTSREAGLLLIDIVTLLGQAGALPQAVDRVTQLMMAIAPAGADGLSAAREPIGLATLTPR